MNLTQCATLALCVLALGCTDKSTTDTDTDTEVAHTDPAEGSTWNLIGDQIPGGYYLAAWTSGDTTLMVGGDIGLNTGSILRYDGDALCVEENVTDELLWWIHGKADNDYYMVGDHGTIVHSLDGVRTHEDVPTDVTLFGVYDDGTDVWAVGGGSEGSVETGEIWRKQGDTWALHTNEVPGVVYKVWDGWIAGNGYTGTLTATGLALETMPVEERFLTVRGPSTDNVFVVGGLATPVFLEKRDGAWASLETDPFCTAQGLNGLWTAPGEPVAIAGNNGATALFQDGVWNCPDFPVSFDHFHAAWKHGDEFLFVGGDLFSGDDNYGVLVSYGPQKDLITPTTCTD